MSEDPLHQPLGLQPARPSRGMRGPVAVVLVLAVALIGAAVVVVLRDRAGPDRDRVAVAPIEPLKPEPAPPPPASPAATPPPPPAATGGLTVTPNGDTVEVQNGVKIIRLGAGRASGATLTVPGAQAVALQPAPDPELIEHTAAGDLPRVGPDGRRPSDVYARPVAVLPVKEAGAPRLALLVGDLGGDPVQSGLAGRVLPAAVSLGFRADGTDAAAAVGRARDAGHEVLLELPGSIPAGAGRVDPLDDLHRMMGRFPGYIGVTAEVGGHFPGGPGAGGLALRDLAARGLLLVNNDVDEPGRAAPPQPGAASPDVVIDGRLPADAVSAALLRLEDVARAKGQALGYLGHPSGNLEAVAAALAGAGSRGVVLVPVSAVVGGASGPGAQSSR